MVVDSMTINDSVQGITNRGGINWTIANNALYRVNDSSGSGGIGICLSVKPGTPSYPACSNNVVSNNTVTPVATDNVSTCPGILLSLDLRSTGASPAGAEITGNEVIGNGCTGAPEENQVGIEVGVAFDATYNPATPAKIAAALPAIHDNIVRGNLIQSVDLGFWAYTATALQVVQNEVRDCTGSAVRPREGWSGGRFSCNLISGNGYGPLNDTMVGDATVDATGNWWGCDAVSSDVLYDPWLQAVPGSGASVSTFTGTGTAVLTTDAGGIRELAALILAAGCQAGSDDSDDGTGLQEATVPHEGAWGIYALDLSTRAVELKWSGNDTITCRCLNHAGNVLAFSRKADEHRTLAELGGLVPLW